MAEQGYGYLEDRRPSSNCDPYSVSFRANFFNCCFKRDNICIFLSTVEVSLQFLGDQSDCADDLSQRVDEETNRNNLMLPSIILTQDVKKYL